VELDPIAAAAHQNLAAILVFSGQYERAASAARHALALDQSRPAAHYWLGWSLLMQGRLDEALAEFEQESIDWQRRVGRGMTLARMGKSDLARQELQSFQERSGDAASYQYAEICAALGDNDQAFHWLANARRVRDPGLMSQVYVDPMLEPLRSDPRWAKLVRELGFVPAG
jgi:tetratricopeptide (TPR) repeat protein